jgi:predicted PurR-regulated permease PerM
MSTLTPTIRQQRPGQTSIAILALAATVALLYFGRVFFITLATAIIIAFLLDPVVTAFVRLRLPRPLASFVVCSISLLLLYLLGLGLYTEVSGLVEDLPAYSQRINELVDTVASRADQYEKRTYQLVMPKRFQEREQQIENTQQAAGAPKQKGRKKTAPDPPPPAPNVSAPNVPVPIPEVRIHSDPTPLFTYVYGYLRSFYNVLLMASFVPFLVYFMLSWRDHMRRSFLYLFSASDRYIAGKSWEGVADMVRAYVIGNFILGLLLATITCVFFFSISLPYWILIGILSGFLSLVPYVGLPMAILPAVFAGLAAYNRPAIYFVMIAVIATLHLVALNLLYPKMVGARVHLNPLVVTIALMLWGTLWGAIGLVLAIPITAGIKAVCDNVSSLQGYGKLLGD